MSSELSPGTLRLVPRYENNQESAVTVRWATGSRRLDREQECSMDLWMYLVVIGMFLIAIVGTVWITLWTIQRGQRARGERPGGAPRARQPGPAQSDKPEPPAE